MSPTSVFINDLTTFENGASIFIKPESITPFTPRILINAVPPGILPIIDLGIHGSDFAGSGAVSASIPLSLFGVITGNALIQVGIMGAVGVDNITSVTWASGFQSFTRRSYNNAGTRGVYQYELLGPVDNDDNVIITASSPSIWAVAIVLDNVGAYDGDFDNANFAGAAVTFHTDATVDGVWGVTFCRSFGPTPVSAGTGSTLIHAVNSDPFLGFFYGGPWNAGLNNANTILGSNGMDGSCVAYRPFGS